MASEREITILVDMDGVLANLEDYFLEEFKKKWPEKPFVQINDRRTFLLNKEDIYSLDDVYEILDTEGFFLNFPLIDGAKEALNEMSEMPGVNVFICTTPWLRTYKWSTVEKYRWVEHHLGKKWLNRMILTNDKTVVKGDLLIDDKHEIIGADKNPTWEHVIFTAGHNGHIEGPRRQNGWWSRRTWLDIVYELRAVSNRRLPIE